MLCENLQPNGRQRDKTVLILVLMEDALRDHDRPLASPQSQVLILVLMEDALRVENLKVVMRKAIES